MRQFEHYCYECDRGWHDLIDDTLEKVFAIHPETEIQQIKQKWGRLCIYAKTSEEAKEIINNAEWDSMKICEVCGTQELVGRTTGAWYKALCVDCFYVWKKTRGRGCGFKLND
jgi:hypothetical protein